MSNRLNRRDLLKATGILGCSAAASPLLTPVSFAAAPWDGRLVVIILRGGMDGLDAVQPYGAPELAEMRPGFAIGPDQGAVDLDGYFAMHGAMAPLGALWQAGDLGFVHAVSTPYRDKRSHFDGQDLLEAGTPGLGSARDGWLNRMLQVMPGVSGRTAYAIGRGEMKLLAGTAPVADWSPEADLAISPQAERLARLIMQGDTDFSAALEEALLLSGADAGALPDGEESEGMMQAMAGRRTQGAGHVQIAEFAAEQLRGEARVAAFSINGWDTHNQQSRALPSALDRLTETILTLRDGLGAPVWQRTAVLAMTEFGRTARANGTRGTDHGTAGAMVLAGGAVRGGQVHGLWPGLSEADLYARRDLMPTADVRAMAAWVLRGLTGLDRASLEQVVFPGMDMGSDPGLML